MFYNGLFTYVIAFLGVLKSNAQSSNVTQCVSDYSWAINPLGQTPCLVAAYLETECSSVPFEVNSIPEGNHYTGPSFANATPCLCSSVTYSLISACGGCQGRSFIDWNTWKLNCPSFELTTFPNTIASETKVPSWAYLDPTLTNNTFNVVAAETNATSPQPSSVVIPQSSASESTASAPTVTSAAPSTASSSSHSNAGAIAGGVVGGLAFIAVTVLLLLWFFIRRRNLRASRGVELDMTGSSAPPLMREEPPSRHGPSPMSSDPSSHIYDSPDSNPFPLSPVTSAFYTTQGTNRRSMESFSNSQIGSQRPHGYSGVAEI